MNVDERPRQGQVEEPFFIYLYNNYIERAFITALRVAFEHPATPEKYRYSRDINLSQVDIRSDYPQRISKLPIIVVTLGGGDMSMTYVGDEFMKETSVEVDGIKGYLYGGFLKIGVNIDILAGTKRDIEHLSDIVGVYVRYLFKKKFLEKNIAYVDITNGGITSEEGSVEGPNKVVHRNTITIECQTEFTHYLDKDLYDTIQNIDFQIGTYYGDASDIPKPAKPTPKPPEPPNPYKK